MDVRSRVGVIVGAALIGGLFLAGTAAADHGPVIVVPGRPDVPVIVNGRDVSGTVIEGDWGLYRPGSVAPAVIRDFRPMSWGTPVSWGTPGGRYFPANGRAPRYGRHEVEPPANRILPPPAESFYQVWGSQSSPEPVTISPPYNLPPLILAPEGHGRRPGRRVP
jgi:hypothetical protein